MNAVKVYEMFIKSEEHEEIVSQVKEVDLDWIKPRLDTNIFLLLEEYISLCLVKREQDFFAIGFNCALKLFEEEKSKIEYRLEKVL